MARAATLIVVAFLQITVGKDLTWFPNSNWGNRANWNLGRLTYENEVADFSQVPDNSVIYLDTAVTIGKVVLPVNGKIVLGANAVIRFSNQTQTAANGGAVKNQVNSFIGARQNWWECAENWRTPEGLPADTAPCSKDTAIFPAGASFSFVNANSTVAVQEFILRGIPVTSVTADEFSLTLSVKPDCVAQPAKCSCSVVKCSYGNPLAEQSASNTVGMAAGSIVGILLLLLLLIAVPLAIAVIWFCRQARRTVSYNMESLNEEEMVGRPNNTFAQETLCNPVYDDCAMGKSDDNKVLTDSEVLCNDPTVSNSGAGMGAERLYEDPDRCV